ncbi:MAG: serine/threonine protein kinase, partial [Proteobacteria bacterium]|nr:serine/threonine protein kinase [Pseudomonadota bacterium]
MRTHRDLPNPPGETDPSISQCKSSAAETCGDSDDASPTPQGGDECPEQEFDYAHMAQLMGAHGDMTATTMTSTGTPVDDLARDFEDADGVPVVGAMVRHYEVVRPLGRGGMGQVMLARDTRLGRLVALKFLHSSRQTRSDRLINEARATARLAHNNIIRLYELDEYMGSWYMALEYIDGLSLQAWIHQCIERDRAAHPDQAGSGWPGLPPGRAIELVIPVVRALAYAHRAGVVHRDLKPSNIMLTRDGAVKVLDFGIAQLLDTALSAAAEGGQAPVQTAALTRTGVLIGTRTHMAPEQWRAELIDHRADLWAVGIILYKLIIGAHPLSPLSLARLQSVADLDVPMPRVTDLRPDLGKLATVIDRCLIKRRDDRIESAEALLVELESVSRPHRGRDDGTSPYPGLAAF